MLDRLAHDIGEFRDGVIGRVMEMVQLVALVLLTLWVMVQGYRVLAGQMRESLRQDGRIPAEFPRCRWQGACVDVA